MNYNKNIEVVETVTHQFELTDAEFEKLKNVLGHGIDQLKARLRIVEENEIISSLIVFAGEIMGLE